MKTEVVRVGDTPLTVQFTAKHIITLKTVLVAGVSVGPLLKHAVVEDIKSQLAHKHLNQAA
jgi:hypothetical protein